MSVQLELEKAVKAMTNGDMKQAMEQFMKTIATLRASDNPTAELDGLSNAQLSDLNVLHNNLSDKVKPPFVKGEVLEQMDKVDQYVEQSGRTFTSPAPIPRLEPKPMPSKQEEDKYIKEIEAANPGLNFAALKPDTQKVMLADHLTKQAEKAQGNPMLDKHAEAYQVDLTNKIMDNANNYIGMTKLGPSTGVVLQGELHGTLSSAIQDVKSQLDTPYDLDNLGTTLADRYDAFKLDAAADKAFNLETNAQQKADSVKEFNPSPLSTKPVPPGGDTN